MAKKQTSQLKKSKKKPSKGKEMIYLIVMMLTWMKHSDIFNSHEIYHWIFILISFACNLLNHNYGQMMNQNCVNHESNDEMVSINYDKYQKLFLGSLFFVFLLPPCYKELSVSTSFLSSSLLFPVNTSLALKTWFGLFWFTIGFTPRNTITIHLIVTLFNQ